MQRRTGPWAHQPSIGKAKAPEHNCAGLLVSVSALYCFLLASLLASPDSSSEVLSQACTLLGLVVPSRTDPAPLVAHGEAISVLLKHGELEVLIF